MSYQNEKDAETAQWKQVLDGQKKAQIFSKWSEIDEKISKTDPKPITVSDRELLWHQQIKKDINISCLSFSKKVEHHSWGMTDCMGP